MTHREFLRGDKRLSQLTRDELCDLIDYEFTPRWFIDVLIAELLTRILDTGREPTSYKLMPK
jgi:hypothetical protein